MPFGLQGAPATFQRMMDILLDCFEFAAATSTMSSYTARHGTNTCNTSRPYCNCLEDHGLTVKPKKCQFGMSTCAYLGHIVGNNEVRPDPSKVSAVKEFPTPTSKSQVRAFLGLTGYYRRFIPHYAHIAAVLTDLTRKDGLNKGWFGPRTATRHLKS